MWIRASRYYRTLRFLPLRQLWFLVLRRVVKSRPVSTENVAGRWRGPVGEIPGLPAPTPVIEADRFRFLNVVSRFPAHDIDWRAPGQSRLWRYNLHYFDWLKATDLDIAWADSTLDSWIRHNPPGTVDAWEPYPVSLRVVNWLKYMARRRQWGYPDRPEWFHSLQQQVHFLEHNIEFHIRANHLFKNIVALVWFWMSVEGKADAERHLKRYLDLLEGQLREQFHEDGGHYERSPMYHAICLEDCCDLFGLLSVVAPESAMLGRLRQVMERGLAFLRAMSFADGDISLFADSTLNGGQRWDRLQHYWHRLNRGGISTATESVPAQIHHFYQTGYVVYRGDGFQLIVSTKGPSPSFQPGHAHCDTGSFELFVGNRRIIVDSGLSQYEPGLMRQYVRSSRAHNVVTVNDQEQNELWGEFRVGARLAVNAVDVQPLADGVRIRIAMQSNATTKPAYSHERQFIVTGHDITIRDRVQAGSGAMLACRFHIHPDISLQEPGNILHCRADGFQYAAITLDSALRQRIESSYYCPEFGRVFDNACLVGEIELEGGRAETVIETAISVSVFGRGKTG